uniref:Nfu1 n=1 Tax=Stygiella incarcerata TaxID=1712417 RepID=A0A192ZIL6_9EUKA|nr:Nfu1 [Stygiella incarcerata]|eukprot:TRINITY_DN1377_c0_g1_i1.p1 TRINITY_DN1377_c0_g1~~TRINITY_DN1377_c0_g1_i1.p1  ORF type:complete len:209 (-),score=67.75 TRINITY_DN1377_c0_g1_i1:286-912(-)
MLQRFSFASYGGSLFSALVRSLRVKIETTPNPHSNVYHVDVEVIPSGTVDFMKKEEAAENPLARSLFDIDGVRGVLFTPDSIAVTKFEQNDFAKMNPPIRKAIELFFAGESSAASPVKPAEETKTEEQSRSDREVIADVMELLDKKIRPVLEDDGGGADFVSFKDGVVYLQLRGACHGCPSATRTLKDGIERLMTYYIPEVKCVEKID